MPTAFVKKMSKKHKISVDKSEKLWDKAKAAAAKQDQENNFALITTIYKKMLGESFASYLKNIN